MANTLKFGNGEWYGKKDTILAYNDENNNYKPLPFEFSRASGGTVINKDGLIETVGSGIPRVDYSNDSNGALLLEPSRTNLITYSEDFSQWSIISSGIVITDNTNEVLSPSGRNDASKVQFNAASKILGQSPALSGNYSGFVYVKGTQGETIRFNFGGTEENFTLTGGWDKLERTNITATANAFNLNTFGGATARTIYVYGAQLEQGSYPTSYIPTSGGIETRVAESSSQTNISNNIISSSYPFTMYVECKNVYGGGVALSFLDISSADKYFNISIVNNVVTAYSRANSSLENIISGIALTKGQKFKAAFTMESATSGKLAVNGIVISKTNFISQSINVNINDLLLGQLRTISDTGDRLPIKDVRVYNTALTDQELQQLTS